MICFPNAKINIGLHITEKRPDGYHNIESIFYPIPLSDALEVVINDRTSFTQTGLPLETAPEDNLVMKAYALMAKIDELPTLDIFLKKVIPSGAGLGGGSADAAFMLKLLRAYGEDDNLSLLKIAESIGADCPFFIRNTPAIVTGTGNVFQPSDISLKGFIIFIVKPPVAISTKEAYSMIRPQKPVFSLNKLSSIPVHEWKYVVKNDFEPGLFKKYPLIADIKDKLYSMGAEYVSMSGSGSAVYGLFKKNPASPASLMFPNCYTWKGILD